MMREPRRHAEVQTPARAMSDVWTSVDPSVDLLEDSTPFPSENLNVSAICPLGRQPHSRCMDWEFLFAREIPSLRMRKYKVERFVPGRAAIAFRGQELRACHKSEGRVR